MHELSLCRAIADTARDHAGGRELARVTVRIGHLRQVVPDTLHHCWGLTVDDTPLAGCELVIEHVPAVAACRACGARTTLDQPVLRCASCDGRDLVLESGDEFLVASIDVLEAI
ncbi:MAG: hydrogenase maturation nickel metallochaperone HypA [Actinomycetota bacterium]|nr:hydrogenase maturation nickel metallochaperone HypA [Actinomycetota bacterium]